MFPERETSRFLFFSRREDGFLWASFGNVPHLLKNRADADWQSAIRRAGSLRYGLADDFYGARSRFDVPGSCQPKCLLPPKTGH